jgi:hypothetical protein
MAWKGGIMLTKLSRIFGITGSALALLAISYGFIKLIYFPGEVLFDWDGRPYSIPAADAIPLIPQEQTALSIKEAGDGMKNFHLKAFGFSLIVRIP